MGERGSGSKPLAFERLLRARGRRMLVGTTPFEPVAASVPVDLAAVATRVYGAALEDCAPGTIFRHPRGLTLDAGLMADYARTFSEMNPIHLNRVAARAAGYRDIPAVPHLLLNVALSLGVQTDSERAVANLGYDDVRYLRPVYAGDTLTSLTRVVSRRERGPGRPGIVTVETRALNARGQVVVRYLRRIMLPRDAARPGVVDGHPPGADQAVFAAEADTLRVPRPREVAAPLGLTTEGSLFGAFRTGQILLHVNGRTVTDEHLAWTNRLGNTHPLHVDAPYAAARSGPMSGRPIVYGGLVLAWVLGLASRDTAENAAWDLGLTAAHHTAPTVSGDTLTAISRVLSVSSCGPEWGPASGNLGIVRLQVIGLRNLRPAEALARHGAALFATEEGKVAPSDAAASGAPAEAVRIPEKVLELERALLVRTTRL
jgi:2-methylfumaryl-CoA hydratase